MERKTTESIWRTKRQNNKTTDTCSSEERRKISSKNRYIRTCYRRSSVTGTKRMLFTAYHPQTDGQTKQINQEVGTFLRYYVNY